MKGLLGFSEVLCYEELTFAGCCPQLAKHIAHPWSIVVMSAMKHVLAVGEIASALPLPANGPQ